jgi:glycosyltransferase involved in cell wall biosynthesis
MKNPKVSIIMPVYNGEKYLREAIESILNQTFNDFELIIINDGSTDKTEEIIKPYLNNDRIRYFKQNNQGYSAACNQGYLFAKGKYICFQDCDDISLPNRLKEEVEILENNVEIELVYSSAIFLDDDGKPFAKWGGIKSGEISHIKAFYKLYIEGNFIPNPTVMFRRRHISSNNLFREDLKVCADYEHHLITIHDHDIYEIEKPIVKIRRGSSHKHLTASREENFKAERKILKNIRKLFWNKEPKVTLLHFYRAMSNQLLKESNYYIRQGKKKKSIQLLIKSIILNPFQLRAWRAIVSRLFPKPIIKVLKNKL